MKSLVIAALLVATGLVGCSVPATSTSPRVDSQVQAQDNDQDRLEAYAAIKKHFQNRYGQHIFSMQVGVEGPVFAFAVTIGEDAFSKVKYLGRYDHRTGNLTIDDIQDVGPRR